MRGSLSEGALPGLLRDLYVGRQSGFLHFTQPQGQRSVRFRKGNIIHAVSSVPEERLGETLVRLGRLTNQDHARASEIVARDRKRLGAVLIELGLMDRAGLEEALAAHVREILLKIFASHEGSYFFEEVDVQVAGDDEVTLRLSTGEMILEAVRLVGEPAAVLHGLGDMGRFITPATDPLLRFQKLSLSPVDAFLLSRIDGALTAEEVLELAPVELDQARRSLLGLLCTGMVQYRTDKPKPSKRFPTVRKRLATMRFAVKNIAGNLKGAAAAPAAPAPPEPARPTPADPPIAPAPGAAAAAAVPTPPAPTTTPSREATAPPPAPKPEEPSPEERARRAQARRDEILELHAALQTRDHFEVLGLERSCKQSEVKEAYFRLARRFHPDTHHDESLSDLAEQIEAIFIRVGEAYDTLRNPQTRTAYEERFSPRWSAPRTAASAPPPAASAAATETPAAAAAPSMSLGEALRLGEMRFAEEKYFDVVQMLEPHLPVAKGRGLQRARLLLARTYAKNPNWVKRADEELQKVIHDDPENLEAYYQLAMIYKRSGLKTRATNMFRKVLELEPNHLEANQEIRALTPDETAPEPQKGGLLKKLFGKD